MPVAIIVDDEPNLASYLQDKLATVWPDLQLAGIAHNAAQARVLIEQHQPDIIFLDIQMPGESGLELAKSLPDTVRAVFVTAFDEYAVEAFQQAAVDYLLKPVSEERLRQTVERLQRSMSPDRDALMHLLEGLRKPEPNYLRWIRAGLDETTQLVSIHDVVFFQAGQKYTSVFTRDREHLVRTSITELVGQLDPEAFWQIHRGTIVQVAQVAKARRDLRGRYALTLRDRPETLRCSLSYAHLFRKM